MRIEQEGVDLAIMVMEPDLNQALCDTFELEGFSVIGQTITHLKQNPQNINLFFKRYNPRLLLVEVAHPIPNNWTVFEEIRKKLPKPETPIVLFSSDPTELERQRIPLRYRVLNRDTINLNEWEEIIRQELSSSSAIDY